VTALESAILTALEENAIHKAAEDEVTLAALKSAVDDLMVAQAGLQAREARLIRWLEAIRDGAVDLESAQAMCRVALAGGKEPPRNAR